MFDLLVSRYEIISKNTYLPINATHLNQIYVHRKTQVTEYHTYKLCTYKPVASSSEQAVVLPALGQPNFGAIYVEALFSLFLLS